MEINKNLSLEGCWKMVNNIYNATTPDAIRNRCLIAERWLKANVVISSDDFDELMMAVSGIYRELSYL